MGQVLDDFYQVGLQVLQASCVSSLVHLGMEQMNLHLDHFVELLSSSVYFFRANLQFQEEINYEMLSI
jgi:hypothetical protein